MTRILTPKQAAKRVHAAGKSVDLKSFSLIEDQGSFFLVSSAIRNVDTRKYRIKRIGLPL